MQSTNSDRLSAAVGVLNLDIEAMSMPETGPLEASSYCSSALKRNFPGKLFRVLADEANFEILHWLPGGKAFIIYDKKRFAANILPRFFKQSQFTSFTRKMSRWSYVRVNRGPLMGAYYHKLFQKDKPALCRLMTCKGNNDRDADYIGAPHKTVKACRSTDIDIDIPISGADSHSVEDMLSLIMLEHSAQEVTIAQQQLDERQARINRLLQMQRCKQACQALGIPVSPDLQLSQLVHAESNAIKSANNAPQVDAFNMETQLLARAVERARLLARARLTAQANQLEGFTESIVRSAQLQSPLLQSSLLRSSQHQSSLLRSSQQQSSQYQSIPLNITAERVLSERAILDRCFRTSAS